MTKRQSIPIAILLLWFLFTFSFYTTASLVGFGADIVGYIKNSGLFPGWLNGFFSIILSNLDQYLSMAITGFVVGLIFSNYKKSLMVMSAIYTAYIVPNLLLAIYSFNQMHVNRFVFYSGKIAVYVFDYLIIYCFMAFSLRIFKASLTPK